MRLLALALLAAPPLRAQADGPVPHRYGVTGLALGALFGALLYRAYADDRYPDGELNGLAAVFEGAPLGALAGLGVGLAMGREKWGPVGGTSFRLSVSPGAGAVVSLRVR